MEDPEVEIRIRIDTRIENISNWLDYYQTKGSYSVGGEVDNFHIYFKETSGSYPNRKSYYFIARSTKVKQKPYLMDFPEDWDLDEFTKLTLGEKWIGTVTIEKSSEEEVLLICYRITDADTNLFFDFFNQLVINFSPDDLNKNMIEGKTDPVKPPIVVDSLPAVNPIAIPSKLTTQKLSQSKTLDKQTNPEEIIKILMDSKHMKTYFEHYNSDTAFFIFEKIPEAWAKFYANGAVGVWGPGFIGDFINMSPTTIGRYFKTFHQAGINKVIVDDNEEIPIPYRQNRIQNKIKPPW